MGGMQQSKVKYSITRKSGLIFPFSSTSYICLLKMKGWELGSVVYLWCPRIVCLNWIAC